MHKLCVRSSHAQISDCSSLLAQSDADLLMYAWGENQNRPVYTYTNGILISIHSSISPFSATIQVTVTRAAVLKEKPRVPSPQPPLPGHPMGQWIEPKPAKRWNLSSESWVCSGAWCPEHIPQKMSSRHANQFHSFSHYSKLMKTGEGMNSMTLGLICRDVHFWDDCRIVLTHI